MIDDILNRAEDAIEKAQNLNELEDLRGVQAHAKHKKILKKAKGYYGARSKVYRVAKQAVIKGRINTNKNARHKSSLKNSEN